MGRMERRHVNARWIAGVLILLAMLQLAQVLAFGWEPVDDAYISFRYARNFASGTGLVYNVGERVEGYTNFLWTMMLSAVAAAGFALPVASMAMGTVLGWVGLYLTYRLARDVHEERGLPLAGALFAPVLLVLYPGWAYWSASGMEPMLLACLVLGCLLMATRVHSLAAAVLLGLLAAAAAMTRWEAVVVWPVLAWAVVGGRARAKRFFEPTVVFFAMTAVIVFGIYFLLRYRYSGDLFPNTFHAKTGAPLMFRMYYGLRYTGELGVCWLLPIAGVVWLYGLHGRRSVLVTAAVGVYALYVIWTGGDFFSWLRFYMPVLPGVAVICGFAVTKLLTRRAWSPGIRVATLAAMVALMLTASYRLDFRMAQGHAELVHDWTRVGQWARQTFDRSTVLASAPIGAVGYYSDMKILDLLGLTDREIARHGVVDLTEPVGHRRYHVEAVLRRRPAVVLGNSLYTAMPVDEAEAIRRSRRAAVIKLVQHPDFDSLYRYEIAEYEGGFIPHWRRRGDLAK